jgi:hypothetical protein
MESTNEYMLTDDEKGMLQPLLEMQKQIESEAQGLLRAIIRLRRLDGNWSLNGDRLIQANTNGSGVK